jgi:4,5-dihydroxyphthalate decarboxylase
MSRLQLVLACGQYDRTEALQTGTVTAEGIDLIYVPVQSPPELFARMVHKSSFDVAEMSLSLYLQSRGRDDFPFVALPIFPSRMFRHSYVFVNQSAAINDPADLAGRRIGVQEYHQTAGVWIRGILAESYGVDFSGVSWLEGGVNAPRELDPRIETRPHSPLDITFIGGDQTLSDWLVEGRIDAYFGARVPRAFHHSATVRRLFEDAHAEERKWFIQTGIFPIMHTLVVQEELLARHPWIAESLFKAFEASKPLVPKPYAL